MGLFHVIDDAYVVLRSRGIYRQAKVYVRDDQLYAGLGGGFVRILGSNGTSAPNVSWAELVPPPKHVTAAGRMGVPEFKQIEAPK